MGGQRQQAQQLTPQQTILFQQKMNELGPSLSSIGPSMEYALTYDPVKEETEKVKRRLLARHPTLNAASSSNRRRPINTILTNSETLGG